MSWDAVVVGAGHNGLVAANLLADAGWSVLVLEAAPRPGGATSSAELAAPGYLSDRCSAFYPLTSVSPVIRDLGLDEYGLHWRHSPVPLAYLMPDDRAVTLSRDLAETAASVERYAPGDGERWEREFAGWQRIRDEVVGSLLSPFPPVRSATRLVRRLGPADALRLARFALLSTRRYGAEAFRGDGARLLLAGCALHSDLTLDAAGGAVLGWLLAMLAQDVGFPVAEGGAQSIADALVRRLEARGGEVRCDARVTKVEVRDGAATGVRTADGEPYPARRAVLADVPAPGLYRDLVGPEHLPSRVATDLEDFHWDDATVKVDWGAVRAGALVQPRGRPGRDRAPGPGPGRVGALRAGPGRPADAGGAVHPARADGHGRSGTVAGRDRDGLGVHARAPGAGLGRRTGPARPPIGCRPCSSGTRPGSPTGSSGARSPRRTGCRPRARTSTAGRSAAGPRRCSRSWCSGRRPGSGGPTHRWTGSTWPRPRPTPAGVCTARAGPTRPARPWPATGPRPGRSTARPSPVPAGPSGAIRNRVRSLRSVLAAGVARLRAERGLGEDEAAALLRSYGLVGWQAGTVTQVEAGVRPLAIEELLLVCAAYRVSVAELTGPDPEPVELAVGAGCRPRPCGPCWPTTARWYGRCRRTRWTCPRPGRPRTAGRRRRTRWLTPRPGWAYRVRPRSAGRWPRSGTPSATPPGASASPRSGWCWPRSVAGAGRSPPSVTPGSRCVARRPSRTATSCCGVS